MYLPYDVFQHILKHSNMLTTLHLYNVDQTLRKLCHSPFMTALLEYRKTEFFNPDIDFKRLDDFLNDLTLNMSGLKDIKDLIHRKKMIHYLIFK